MDKGFYSRKNVNDLFDKRMKFTFAKEQVERVRNTITDHDNFIQVNDQNLFCISSLNKWAEKNGSMYMSFIMHRQQLPIMRHS